MPYVIKLGVVDLDVSGAIGGVPLGAIPGFTVADVGTVPMAIKTLPAVLLVETLVLACMVVPSPILIAVFALVIFVSWRVMFPLVAFIC